jgi:hypothetical protein
VAIDPPQEVVADTDSLDDLLEDLLSGESATTSPGASVDFRIEINCQKGHHYMRTRRGSGTGRRKENGKNGKETYRYDGPAEIVAGERKGYYGSRWREYQSNHECHYQVAQADQATLVGYPGVKNGVGSPA